MPSFQFSNVAIKAIATAVPANIKKFDISNRQTARFVKQMGIEQVHISITEQTAVDLGYVALQQALDKVGWSASDLDMLIVNTQTPDFIGGAGNAALLHHYMKLNENCGILDTSAGCAAVPHVLSIAGSVLESQSHVNRIAAVIGDIQWMSYCNPEHIESTDHMLFGESVGVVLLEKQKHAPELEIKLFADGDGYKYLMILNGVKNLWHQNGTEVQMPDGARFTSNFSGKMWHIYMNGIAIHEFSTGRVCDCIKEYYGSKLNNYDYIVFHQANKQIINTLTSNLNLDASKVLSSIANYGNNSGASPLVAICDHLYDIKDSVHIFNASFGIGLTWGFVDFILNPDVVCPIVYTDHVFKEHACVPVA